MHFTLLVSEPRAMYFAWQVNFLYNKNTMNMMHTRDAPTLDLLMAHQEQIRALCRKYGVRSLQVFGSVARGEGKEGSDVDLLVRFSRPVSLLHLIRLERELSEVLGARVDLVTERALSPYIRAQVIAASRVVYESA